MSDEREPLAQPADAEVIERARKFAGKHRTVPQPSWHRDFGKALGFARELLAERARAEAAENVAHNRHLAVLEERKVAEAAEAALAARDGSIATLKAQLAHVSQQLQAVILGRRAARDERQSSVHAWALDCFGERAMTLTERAARVLEEAVELAQAEGLDLAYATKVMHHVYGKPPGEPAQEVGGIAVTLLCYCAVKGLSADVEESREIGRVLAKPREHFMARHDAKRVAGVAV